MNDRSADSSRKQKKSERNSCIRIFIGHQKEEEWLSQQKLILWSSCFDNLSQVPENQFFSGGRANLQNKLEMLKKIRLYFFYSV